MSLDGAEALALLTGYPILRTAIPAAFETCKRPAKLRAATDALLTCGRMLTLTDWSPDEAALTLYKLRTTPIIVQIETVHRPAEPFIVGDHPRKSKDSFFQFRLSADQPMTPQQSAEFHSWDVAMLAKYTRRLTEADLKFNDKFGNRYRSLKVRTHTHTISVAMRDTVVAAEC